MNKRILLFLALFFVAFTIKAQSPQSVCYQAVATDAAGTELQSQLIKVRATIVKDSPTGVEEWVENHEAQTDDFGLFSITIGRGMPSGGALTNFSDIQWGQHAFFLKIEVDLDNGNGYQFMGVSQMLSVPYALHAEGASRSITAQTAAYADTTSVAHTAHTALDDADKDATNELQSLSFDELTGTLSLSNSEVSIVIPGATPNLDNDPINEIQNADQVNVTSGVFQGQTVQEALENINQGGADADNDPANEIQTASQVNIANGTFAGQNVEQALESLSQNSTDADNDSTNELQNANEVNVTGGTYNGQDVQEALELIAAALNADNDPSNTNEIQTADEVNVMSGTYSGQNIQQALEQITTALGQHTDDDSDATNEIQTASEVNVTGGNYTGQTVQQALETIRTALLADDDGDSTNELQDANEVNITGGSFSGQNVQTALEDIKDLQDADDDSDSTNEIQELIFDGEVIGITGGNTINLGDIPLGAPGASVRYPQGIIGDYVVVTTADYTVPAGKNFYMTGGPPSIQLMLESGAFVQHPTAPSMPIVDEGHVIKNCNCLGLLVDINTVITATTVDFQTTPVYTVPAGKVFVIKSGMVNDDISYLVVNGQQIEFFRPNYIRASNLLSFPEGTTLQMPNNVTQMALTGYLMEIEP